MRRSRTPGSFVSLKVTHRASIWVCSGSWMASLIGFLQMATTHRSVYLGGGQVRVSQQVLDGAQVGTAFEEMCGERGCDGGGEGRQALGDDPSNATCVHGTAPLPHPKRLPGVGSGELGAAPREVVGQRLPRRPAQRHHPLLVAL